MTEMITCPACGGSKFKPDGIHPCEVCEGKGKVEKPLWNARSAIAVTGTAIAVPRAEATARHAERPG